MIRLVIFCNSKIRMFAFIAFKNMHVLNFKLSLQFQLRFEVKLLDNKFHRNY